MLSEHVMSIHTDGGRAPPGSIGRRARVCLSRALLHFREDTVAHYNMSQGLFVMVVMGSLSVAAFASTPVEMHSLPVCQQWPRWLRLGKNRGS